MRPKASSAMRGEERDWDFFRSGQRVWKEQVYLLSRLHFHFDTDLERQKPACVCWLSLPLPPSLFNKWVCLRVSTRRAPVDRQLHSPSYLPGETRSSRAVIPTRCGERSALFFIRRPLERSDDTGRDRWVHLPASTFASVLSAKLRNTLDRYYGLSAQLSVQTPAAPWLCVMQRTLVSDNPDSNQLVLLNRQNVSDMFGQGSLKPGGVVLFSKNSGLERWAGGRA